MIPNELFQWDIVILKPDIAMRNAEERLNEAGIPVEVAASDGDAMLAGEYDGCIVCINETVKMIYVEKPVKRAAKHIMTLENWNQEDIRTSYFTNKNKVVCKRVFNEDTIVEDVKAVVGRLSNLR